MHMGPPIDNTAVQWTTSNVVTATKPEHAKQRWWNEKVHKAKLTDFNRMATEAEITRIKCQQKPSTGIWLSAQPNSALALKLTNTEMCILLKWWLGAPVLGEEHDGQPCPLCDEPIDVQGAHFLSCKKAGNHLRHDNICESIAALAHAAGVRIKREKVIYGQNRPDDILLYGWREGKAAAMDITIVNPLFGMSHYAAIVGDRRGKYCSASKRPEASTRVRGERTVVYSVWYHHIWRHG